MKKLILQQIQNSGDASKQGRFKAYEAAFRVASKLDGAKREKVFGDIEKACRELEAAFADAEKTTREADNGQADPEGQDSGQVLHSANGQVTVNSALPEEPPQATLELSENDISGKIVEKKTKWSYEKFLPGVAGWRIVLLAIVGILVFLLLAAIFIWWNTNQNQTTKTSAPVENSSKPAKNTNVGDLNTIANLDFKKDTSPPEYVLRAGGKRLDPAEFRPAGGGLKLLGPVRVFSRGIFRIDPDATYLGVLKLKLPDGFNKNQLPILSVGVRNLNAENEILSRPNAFTNFVHRGRLSPRNLVVEPDNTARLSGLITVGQDDTVPGFPQGSTQFNAFVAVAPGGSETGIELLSYEITRIE